MYEKCSKFIKHDLKHLNAFLCDFTGEKAIKRRNVPKRK